MIHEAARQLPSGAVPDAVLCSAGGGGLLGGVIRGMNDVGWDQSTPFNLAICAYIAGSDCDYYSSDHYVGNAWV